MRFHQNLRAAGRTPTKQVLSIITRLAGPQEREALQLDQNAHVHVYDGLSFGDDQPVALFCSIFPAARFPDLPVALDTLGSVTAALKANDISDYTRSWTRLTATAATATQALHLRVAEGAPLLRSVGVNVDMSAQPIEMGRTWFAGDRVTLTLSDEM